MSSETTDRQHRALLRNTSGNETSKSDAAEMLSPGGHAVSRAPRGGKKGPSLFKQRDFTRLLRSVRQAGAKIVDVRFAPGEITARVDLTEETAPNGDPKVNPCDEVYDQDTKRSP